MTAPVPDAGVFVTVLWVSVATLVAVVLGTSPAWATVPGANGRFAYGVWTSPSGVRHEIFTVRANGTGNRRLPVGLASHPQWSADGRSIAFDRWLAGEGERAGIGTAAADGSSPARILPQPARRSEESPGETPVWAPDGKHIAYSASWELISEEGGSYGEAFVFVAGLDGSPPRQLAEGFWPAWSPDGQQIAFIALGGVIKVIAPDGSGERVVARLSDSPWGAMDFSPDGRTLLFSELHSRRGGGANVQLRALDLRTGSIRTFHPRGRVLAGAAWAPSGKKIAYLLWPPPRPGAAYASATEIWTMRPDGSHQRRRFALSHNRQAESLAWQPRPSTNLGRTGRRERFAPRAVTTRPGAWRGGR